MPLMPDLRARIRKKTRGRAKSLSSEYGKRRRTYFVVRRRYRLARWVVAAIGMFVVTLAIRSSLAKAHATGFVFNETIYGEAAILILAGMAVPWLLVEAMWRWTRRRRFWDWP
jgi:hypothetical protein